MKFSLCLSLSDLSQYDGLIRYFSQDGENAFIAFDEAVDTIGEVVIGTVALNEEAGFF